jgi:hypothetical protein
VAGKISLIFCAVSVLCVRVIIAGFESLFFRWYAELMHNAEQAVRGEGWC